MNGQGTSGDQRAARQAYVDKRFMKPQPTRTFGPVGPPDPITDPAGPSQAEIENLKLIRRAMDIRNPWAQPQSPSSSEDSGR